MMMDYANAILCMAGALEPAEESVGSEYRRGVVGALAELYAIEGRTIDERMEDVDADLTRQLKAFARGDRRALRRDLYNVEVQVKVRADNDDEAWKRVHDYMAATITAPPFDPNVVDFELLDESATLEA